MNTPSFVPPTWGNRVFHPYWSLGCLISSGCLLCLSITCLTNSLHSTPSAVFLVTLWPAPVSWYVRYTSHTERHMLSSPSSSVFCTSSRHQVFFQWHCAPSNSLASQSHLFYHVKCTPLFGDYLLIHSGLFEDHLPDHWGEVSLPS